MAPDLRTEAEKRLYEQARQRWVALGVEWRAVQRVTRPAPLERIVERVMDWWWRRKTA